MDDGAPEFFATPDHLRRWFEEHHQTAVVLWLGYFKKASGRPSVSWEESVEQALCFGWIDGVRRSLDDERYVIRFTPRRAASVWSDRNITSMGDLLAQDLVAPAGIEAFERRREDRSRRYSFEQGRVQLPDEYSIRFQAVEDAWAWFSRQGAYYRRTATWWVISAKREPTRQRRLDVLIESSAQGRRIPAMRPTR